MQLNPYQVHELLSPAYYGDNSDLAGFVAVSFSRVAAARRIPVFSPAQAPDSGFLARARHARGNDITNRAGAKPL
jgi:hypothetical protein